MNKLDPKLKDALEWIGCFIIAIVVIFLGRFFIGTPTIVKQISMYPTLEQDQRLWLNRWGRTIHALPKRGEIITFEEPSKISYSESEIDVKNPVAKFYDRKGWEWFVDEFLEFGDKRSYIKRVIATPGEHVEIKEGKVYINGEKLQWRASGNKSGTGTMYNTQKFPLWSFLSLIPAKALRAALPPKL